MEAEVDDIDQSQTKLTPDLQVCGGMLEEWSLYCIDSETCAHFLSLSRNFFSGKVSDP